MSMPMSCHVQPKCLGRNGSYVFPFSRPSQGNEESLLGLLATRWNDKLLLFVSTVQDLSALALDALSMSRLADAYPLPALMFNNLKESL